jgi:hypothetical protein
MFKLIFLFISIFILMLCQSEQEKKDESVQVSGIFPHLDYYNEEIEHITGAVVPWAGRLWVNSYGAYGPIGSSDELYEVTPDLKQIIHDESIGGAQANHMVRKESIKLFLGPNAINENRNLRVTPYSKKLNRHTGKETLTRYDLVNVRRFIQTLGFYTWGFRNETYPKTSSKSAYHKIKASKEVFIVPETGHWTYPEKGKKIENRLLYKLVGPSLLENQVGLCYL